MIFDPFLTLGNDGNDQVFLHPINAVPYWAHSCSLAEAFAEKYLLILSQIQICSEIVLPSII